MSRYSRHNPEEPIRHDWLAGARTSTAQGSFAGPAGWKPDAEEIRYLQCVVSMSTDSLVGQGTDSRKTFTNNLRMIAEQLDKLPETQASNAKLSHEEGGKDL